MEQGAGESGLSGKVGILGIGVWSETLWPPRARFSEVCIMDILGKLILRYCPVLRDA